VGGSARFFSLADLLAYVIYTVFGATSFTARKVVRDPAGRRFPTSVRVVLKFVGADEFVKLAAD